MTSIENNIKFVEQLCLRMISHNNNCIELSSLLTIEQECIIQNNSVDLLDVIEKKQKLLNVIEEDQLKINSIIANDIGIDKTSQSVNRFFDTFKDLDLSLCTKARDLWKIFLQTSSEIEQKNLVNGHLLNKQNAKNQLLITLLRGKKHTQILYGENGKSSKPSYSAHLGQA